MKKVLFFDMYQTLVDTLIGDKKEVVENSYRIIFSDFLIQNNIDAEKANMFYSKYKMLQDEFYLTHDQKTEHHDFKKVLAQTFQDIYTINIDDEVLNELIWRYRVLTRGDTRLYSGVKETLERLSKEYKIFIASYTQACYSLRELEELGVKSYFIGFVFSSDIGYKKMNDNFYKRCIEVSGMDAKDCVMIGDNTIEDMFMAHKNGMKTIWIKNPITMKKEGVCEVAHDKELAIEDFTMLDDLLNTL